MTVSQFSLKRFQVKMHYLAGIMLHFSSLLTLIFAEKIL